MSALRSFTAPCDRSRLPSITYISLYGGENTRCGMRTAESIPAARFLTACTSCSIATGTLIYGPVKLYLTTFPL